MRVKCIVIIVGVIINSVAFADYNGCVIDRKNCYNTAQEYVDAQRVFAAIDRCSQKKCIADTIDSTCLKTDKEYNDCYTRRYNCIHSTRSRVGIATVADRCDDANQCKICPKNTKN